MIEFDGPNLIITLAGGQTSVTAREIYSAWKVWASTADNAKFLAAFRVVGGDPLTVGINAGSYFFLRNDFGWRIKPPEENINIFLVGNIVPEDSALDVLLPSIGPFSTAIFGLQPITQSVDQLFELQKITDYMGIIHINTHGGGLPGTSHPVGTASVPVSNLIDALSLKSILNIGRFKLHGDITFTEILRHTHWKSTGITSSINFQGFSIERSVFEDLILSGDFGDLYTDPPTFISCTIKDTLNIWGNFRDCGFSSTNSFSSSIITIANCSADGYDSNTIFNFNGSATKLVVNGLHGRLSIHNLNTPGAKIILNMDAAELTLDSSCTAGSVFLSGTGFLVDNSNGTVVNRDALIDREAISMSVWDRDVSDFSGAGSFAEKFRRNLVR